MLTYATHVRSGSLERHALVACRELAFDTVSLELDLVTRNVCLVPLVSYRGTFPKGNTFLCISPSEFGGRGITYPEWAPEARFIVVLNEQYTAESLRGQRYQDFLDALRDANRRFKLRLKEQRRSIQSLPRLMPDEQYMKLSSRAVPAKVVPKRW
jgi:hypothetical protein